MSNDIDYIGQKKILEEQVEELTKGYQDAADRIKELEAIKTVELQWSPEQFRIFVQTCCRTLLESQKHEGIETIRLQSEPGGEMSMSFLGKPLEG